MAFLNPFSSPRHRRRLDPDRDSYFESPEIRAGRLGRHALPDGASVEQNQRRLKIEDLLLLLVRCLMLTLLAIALARPAIKSAASAIFGQAKVTSRPRPG